MRGSSRDTRKGGCHSFTGCAGVITLREHLFVTANSLCYSFLFLCAGSVNAEEYPGEGCCLDYMCTSGGACHSFLAIHSVVVAVDRDACEGCFLQ